MPSPARGHWAVAHQRHDSRAVACDQDRATVRAGRAPQVPAACRNAALGGGRRLGTAKIPATCRQFMAPPHTALVALGAWPHLAEPLAATGKVIHAGSAPRPPDPGGR